MSVGLIVVISLLTYASRAGSLVFMPEPSPRVRAILDRIPAPLFAALAATALVEGGAPAEATTLLAAACGLAATPTRSILWVLLAGLAGYGAGTVVFS